LGVLQAFSSSISIIVSVGGFTPLSFKMKVVAFQLIILSAI